MIEMKNVYSFLESNFIYLLVINEDGKIIHTSEQVAVDLVSTKQLEEGQNLFQILTPLSWKSFLSAMKQAQEGKRAIAAFVNKRKSTGQVPFKVGYLDQGQESVFLCYGNMFSTLSQDKEWEKDERVKELTCFYNVVELIETSKSVEEFFDQLPQYLSAGMLYPEEAIVYSVYDGVQYGQKPSAAKHLTVKLKVWGKERGRIVVGYHDNDKKLLPEEQKMLGEIKRMLNLALERKELKTTIFNKEKERLQYQQRLSELTGKIERRTAELEVKNRKISMVNSYLDKANYKWGQTKTRLDAIFKAIPDEVVLIDTSRKVVMSNKKDVKPGDHCYASIFKRHSPCSNCRLAAIQERKIPLTNTIKEEDKYFQVHALPVYNENHDVDGILEFYRDITIEKTYEQQLQQADKLASIGELVSGIGHEINNPNQFIRGNIKIVEQALQDIMPIIDEYYQAHPDLKIARLNYNFFRDHIMVLINDMARGSERIKSIVKSLRAFAVKDEGLLVDKVEINTLIEETTRLVYKEVHKRSEIELNLEDNLPSFTGNIQKIEQVLINLIVNAAQAIPEDKRGRIKIRTYAADSEIVIEVEDNGSGMKEKTVKQIFNPFFTTKRGKGGTGLGLAIAFRIVEEHGGSLAVKSEEQKGTTFIIKIPTKSLSKEREGQAK